MFTGNNGRQRGNYFPGILRRKKRGRGGGRAGKTLAYVRPGHKGDYRGPGLTRMQAGCPQNTNRLYNEHGYFFLCTKDYFVVRPSAVFRAP